jgi:hypothetical protein
MLDLPYLTGRAIQSGYYVSTLDRNFGCGWHAGRRCPSARSNYTFDWEGQAPHLVPRRTLSSFWYAEPYNHRLSHRVIICAFDTLRKVS